MCNKYIYFYVVFRVQTLTDSVAIATRIHLFLSDQGIWEIFYSFCIHNFYQFGVI